MMKQLIFAMGLMALVSCKDTKNQETDATPDVNIQTIETVIEDHHDQALSGLDNSWTNDIVMDKGNKWPANAETNEGVENMQNSIKTQTTQTLDDYHKLAELLNVDKNYVIKNCTMKGASHDNLHVWLLPLIDKIDALSEAKRVEEAAKIKVAIEENINAYSEYFQ